MKRLFKFAFRMVIFFVVVLCLYVGVTFFQVVNTARHNDVNPSTRVNAIVVLGAAQYNGIPSPVLEQRLKHALHLYKNNIAPVIVVTGGNQPGDTTTEAMASANWLLKRGVKDSDILREVRSHSTYDSFRDLAVFAKEHNIKDIVVVTDGFHMKRSLLIAKDFGFKPLGSPSPSSAISKSKERQYFISETARVSLGRIIGFRRVSRDSSLAGYIK